MRKLARLLNDAKRVRIIDDHQNLPDRRLRDDILGMKSSMFESSADTATLVLYAEKSRKNIENCHYI